MSNRSFSNPAGHWDFPIPGVIVSDGVRVGDLIVVSGQAALDEKGKVQYPGDIEMQTRVTMDHIKRVLADFGATMRDVIKVNAWWVTTAERAERDWETSIRVRSEYFEPPGPASTGIPVLFLTHPGMVTEIEVLAVASRG